MRAIAIIIVILGLVSFIFGILFVTQGASGIQEVADSIAPLPLDQLEDTYEQAKAGIAQMEAAGMEPDLALKLNKTGLGLARANKGTANSVRVNGVVDICVGLALVLTGLGLLRKVQA
jgi:predicted PurR-regulated permease PerM